LEIDRWLVVEDNVLASLGRQSEDSSIGAINTSPNRSLDAPHADLRDRHNKPPMPSRRFEPEAFAG
jgi:hypothetical protein